MCTYTVVSVRSMVYGILQMRRRSILVIFSLTVLRVNSYYRFSIFGGPSSVQSTLFFSLVYEDDHQNRHSFIPIRDLSLIHI